MVLLDQLWDDVSGGICPDHGLGKLRKLSKPINVGEGSKSFMRSLSMGSGSPGAPSTPTTPSSPSSATPRGKDNVWRSVFHPGSNLATKGIGADVFDKPQPNTPTVYDWMYSGDTRSKHHR